MIPPRPLAPFRRLAASACAVAIVLAACESASPARQRATPPTPPPTPAPGPADDEPAAGEAIGRDEALAREQAVRKGLESQLAATSTRLLEKDAQIADLTRRQAELQAKLDEAILEVVRAKGKLRSLESRAEAASTMAEVEVTLASLVGRLGGAEAKQELEQADQFLKLSSQEFQKENYGGALYLAAEAKSRLRSAEAHSSAAEPTALPGESAFAAPLPLETVRNCNLREGPGTEFGVLSTLPKGTKVTALGARGQWLRVKDATGAMGWVFQGLVAAR